MGRLRVDGSGAVMVRDLGASHEVASTLSPMWTIVGGLLASGIWAPLRAAAG